MPDDTLRIPGVIQYATSLASVGVPKNGMQPRAETGWGYVYPTPIPSSVTGILFGVSGGNLNYLLMVFQTPCVVSAIPKWTVTSDGTTRHITACTMGYNLTNFFAILSGAVGAGTRLVNIAANDRSVRSVATGAIFAAEALPTIVMDLAP